MISVKRVLALILAAEAIRTYATALHFVFERDANSVVSSSFGGHLQFLTILSLVASLVRQLLSFLYLLTNLRTLNVIQSWLGLVTTPIEVVVTVLYWPLKIYKNNLVKDRRFGIKIDPELDRKCHLYPALYEFLSSTVFSTRRWVRGNLLPFLVFSTVAGGYWTWVEYTFTINGFYPYPLLAVLSMPQKGVLVAASTIVAFVVYKIVVLFQRA